MNDRELLHKDTVDLFLDIAGYLTLIAKGFPASKQEASELLEKIRAHIEVAA